MVERFQLRHWLYYKCKVEFWALRDGLLLAVQMGILYLEVELDARSVVNIV